MQKAINPSEKEWASLLARPTMQLEEIEEIVKPVLAEVKSKGDAALKAFGLKFDKVELEELQVSANEIAEAGSLLDELLKTDIQLARQNIEKFHSAQKELTKKVETVPGVTCWRKSMPIDKVGLYIPGGTAPLFSTVLMLGIPAKIAGCEEIVLCTPPGKDGKVHPAILYSAHLVGVTKIFKVGGAQAVAAMAYGTESVPQVYKIFGPGNQFVTAAKQLVSKEGMAIDMPAGPSEVAVYADATSNPTFIASDLLSQAEHGLDSQTILVTTEESMVEKVEQAVLEQLEKLPRKEFAAKSLSNSKLIYVKDVASATKMLNAYAAEHLILSTDNAHDIAAGITNAGSVFLGHYTPESAGDYASGTNHTLPTNGFARAFSGVSLDSFIKKITFQEITPQGLRNLGPTVERMAAAEQLDAHRLAVTYRLDSLEG